MVKLDSDYLGYKIIREDDPLLPSLYGDKEQNWFGL